METTLITLLALCVLYILVDIYNSRRNRRSAAKYLKWVSDNTIMVVIHKDKSGLFVATRNGARIAEDTDHAKLMETVTGMFVNKIVYIIEGENLS